jgi:hypothetical protein
MKTSFMLVLAFGKLVLGCPAQTCENMRNVFQSTAKKISVPCADFLENSCHGWTEEIKGCDDPKLSSRFQWMVEQIESGNLQAFCDDPAKMRKKFAKLQLPEARDGYLTMAQLRQMARSQPSDSDSDSIGLGGSRGLSESDVIQTKPKKKKKKRVVDDSVESTTESQRNNDDIEILDIDINSGKGKKKPKKPTKKT